MSYMSTPTSSLSKTDFAALTLWLNREKEAFPHLKKQIVSIDDLSTPTMPGHYASPSERKRKSLGSEMGFYELMLDQAEDNVGREAEFESFEASGILALSPDVSVEQEHHSRQIIVIEMEEEEEQGEENGTLLTHIPEDEESGIFSTHTLEEEGGMLSIHLQDDESGYLSSHIQEEECGHFLDPVEEVTEEPTIIEWEEEDEELSKQTAPPKRVQTSATSHDLHDWARLHGLGTPSSIAPSPAASRFGWAEVIAQTRLEETDDRSKAVTIFSPFSPAKAMGLKTDYWLTSPTKPTLAKKMIQAKPKAQQVFAVEKSDLSDCSDDSLGWIEVQPIATKQVSEYKLGELNPTFRRKTKWATIIPDRFASLRSRSSSR